MSPRLGADRGFSLTEVMVTVAISATLVAGALPVYTDLTADIKLGEATRLVERELQDARLKAVSTNRSLRVRTNCPSPGLIRLVEVLGTEVDASTARCDPVRYRYPPADQNMTTRPNFDGPVKLLPAGTGVSTVAIQFNPDGMVQDATGGAVTNIVELVTIAVAGRARARAVTVNGVGKIQVQ